MKSTSSPLYEKLSFNLISLAILCVALIYGKSILLPILFSILLASLLLPVVRFLAKKNWHKVISILTPLVLSILIGLSIIYFLSSQVAHFAEDFPEIKERLGEVSQSFQHWVDDAMHIPMKKQNQYINEGVNEIKDNATKLLGITVLSLTGLISYFVLMPVYTFLILFYRARIKMFLIQAFKNGSDEKINDILMQSTTIAQSYLLGLLMETAIVFTLNTIGFLVLGIKYAIFLALLAALLNLVPYIGMIVANITCMLITMVSSEDMSKVLWVAGILAVVQIFDNNFGMPMVVGNKVRINALVTLIGILIGGALCGIPGMFLAIPALAFLKVVFDKVPELNHWGVLLSDAPVKGKFSGKRSKSDS